MAKDQRGTRQWTTASGRIDFWRNGQVCSPSKIAFDILLIIFADFDRIAYMYFNVFVVCVGVCGRV